MRSSLSTFFSCSFSFLIMGSSFIIILIAAFESNNPFHVICLRKHINREGKVGGVTVFNKKSAVSGHCRRSARDIDDFFGLKSGEFFYRFKRSSPRRGLYFPRRGAGFSGCP